MSGRVDAVLPFWLDRPDEEAIDIALEVQRAGFGTLWIGELATFDAFALATAVGHRAEGMRLQIGPVAIGVRSPVSIALALSSVATLTGRGLGIALGASSPGSCPGGTTANGPTPRRACARPSTACAGCWPANARTTTAGTCGHMAFGCAARSPASASRWPRSARR